MGDERNRVKGAIDFQSQPTTLLLFRPTSLLFIATGSKVNHFNIPLAFWTQKNVLLFLHKNIITKIYCKACFTFKKQSALTHYWHKTIQSVVIQSENQRQLLHSLIHSISTTFKTQY